MSWIFKNRSWFIFLLWFSFFSLTFGLYSQSLVHFLDSVLKMDFMKPDPVIIEGDVFKSLKISISYPQNVRDSHENPDAGFGLRQNYCMHEGTSLSSFIATLKSNPQKYGISFAWDIQSHLTGTHVLKMPLCFKNATATEALYGLVSSQFLRNSLPVSLNFYKGNYVVVISDAPKKS